MGESWMKDHTNWNNELDASALSLRCLNDDSPAQTFRSLLHSHNAQVSDLISLHPFEIEALTIVGND